MRGRDLLRNTAPTGKPAFAPAQLLVDIPQPWEARGFSPVDWDQDGDQDVVVNVSRDWERTGGAWTCESRLWLYRRGGRE